MQAGLVLCMQMMAGSLSAIKKKVGYRSRTENSVI